MDKGKYIKASLLFVFTSYILFAFVINDALASLPAAGSYKFYTSVFFTDDEAKRFQRKKNDAIIRIGQEIAYYNSLTRKLTSEEQEEKSDLEKFLEELNCFDDHLYNMAELEYGFRENKSLGLRLFYKQDKTMLVRHLNKSVPEYSYKIDRTGGFGGYYKTLLKEGAKWQIIAMQDFAYFEKIAPADVNKNNATIEENTSFYFDCHAQDKKGRNYFSQAGIGVGHKWAGKYSATIAKISLFESFELVKKWNLSLNNYTEQSFTDRGNMFYKSVIYEQVGLAKDVVNSHNQTKFTVQFGYYWKKSLIDEDFIISGPIFSLWMTL